MLDNLKTMQRKHIAFIGKNAVDIVLYVSKICSFSLKVLVIDLSTTECLLDITSPDRCMENQNIRFANLFTMNNELEYSYDLIITFTDLLDKIPPSLVCGDAYVFTTPEKNNLFQIPNEISRYLNNSTNDCFLICRGNGISENLVKKLLYISGISQHMINKVFLLKDNENDSMAMIHMEYNSVFLYDNLSIDLRKFLIFIYNRICETVDIGKIPDETRFKWVM